MIKQCNVCQTWKRSVDFHIRRASSDGRSFTCRDCTNARSATWRKKNPDANRQMKSAWYQKNKDHADTKNAKWARDNRDRSNEIKRKHINADRKKHDLRCSEWQRKNPGKVREIAMRRHAAKKQRTPVWLSEEHVNEMTKTYERAAQIQELTGIETQVDHIMPLQGENVCGLHVPWNLQIMSGTANRKKWNKHNE